VDVAHDGKTGGAFEAWEASLMSLDLAEDDIEESGKAEEVGSEGDRVVGRKGNGFVDHDCRSLGRVGVKRCRKVNDKGWS
jgi:hypothetical protein